MEKGKPKAGENGNWKCENCGNVNFPWRDACHRCKKKKKIRYSSTS